jgi:hypothetical protein
MGLAYCCHYVNQMSDCYIWIITIVSLIETLLLVNASRLEGTKNDFRVLSASIPPEIQKSKHKDSKLNAVSKYMI